MRLLKGFPGKPLHPPLTDASIGSYTLGVAALIAGKAGLQTPEMSHAALIAISFGLLMAAPTAITGLVDWLDIPRGTPARTVATAIALSFPARTWFSVAAGVSNVYCTWPAMRSMIDGPLPLYGTCTVSMPAVALKSSPTRWFDVLLPYDE